MKIKGKCLCLFDVHLPYTDRRAYDLALKVALSEKQQITEILIGGDYLDFYGVNSHGLDPAITKRLFEEVEEGRHELQRLRKLFPKAKIVYLQGNHENRLERYIMKKAPELFNITNTYKILELDKIKAKYIPFTPDQRYNVLGTSLIARHKPLSSGPTAANNTVMKCGASVIYGDIHRVQEAQVVTLDGAYHRGIGVGCLANIKHKVMQYVQNHHQWQLGFAIVTALEDGTWFCQNHTIINYKVVHNGKVFRT